MQTQRRNLIKLITIGSAVLLSGIDSVFRLAYAITSRNKPAFTANQQQEAIDKLYAGETITPSDTIEIGVHDVVENGAVVPISINTDLAGVTSISIFVEKNPNPLIAHFNLNPRCQAFVATRIKMNEPSNILIVVRSDSVLYSTTKFVEVIEGGCG